MRDIIALRAKIDLLQKDTEDYMNECGDPDESFYLTGKCAAYEGIRAMIDEMVGKQLEEMYAEHIQEENKADKH